MSDILNNLLDSNLDDLADLPEFGVFPAGLHKVIISWEQKEVNKHPCVELAFKLVEHIELANPADTQMSAGSSGSVLFMLDNEFGQGKFKQVIKPLATHCGVSNLREAMEQSAGMEVMITTKIRQNKDKTQSYTDVTKVIVA